jgi:hypothetical protein
MEYIKYREIFNGIIYYKNVPRFYYYNKSIKSNNNPYDLFEYSICRTTELNESDNGSSCDQCENWNYSEKYIKKDNE